MAIEQEHTPPALNTFGMVTRTRGINGFYISEVSLPPGLNLTPHKHEMAQICVVLEGTYFETARGRQVALEPGSILVRPPGEIHTNNFGHEETHTLLIDIEPDRFRTLREFVMPDKLTCFRPGAIDEVWREFQTELQYADECSSTALEGLVLLLTSRACCDNPDGGAGPNGMNARSG